MQVPLTSYQANSPIAYTTPGNAGEYTYFIQCRNTTKSYINVVSDAINVSVSYLICSTVTDIPSSECNALMNIYDNNDGANWTNDTNWGTSTTVCNNNNNGWYGVTCTNNSVISIYLSFNNLTGTATFDGSSLPNLNSLDLSSNQLTSFDGTGLTNL